MVYAENNSFTPSLHIEKTVMKKFNIHIEGTAPLLMHSSRLSNPLDPATKAFKKVSGKRTKTDEDHLEMARLEHAGSLYIGDQTGPFVPGDNVFRCLWDAAKKSKSGVKVKEGVVITSDASPLIYAGPRDIAGLWADSNFVHQASVKVGMARVTRTRPVFAQWSTDVQGLVDPNILDIEDLGSIAETAGMIIGLGDWRPRYGRFVATLTEVKG